MDAYTVLRNIPRILRKRGMPIYLLFHVTERCNARCAHCFVDPERRKRSRREELRLHEVEKISETLGQLIWVNITGGEPFLREDLGEILRVLYRNNRVRVFKIVSNGSLPEHIQSVIEAAGRACPGARFVVNLSLDALGREHDRIRGKPGLFEKVQETYRRLRELEKFVPNVETCVEVTVSSRNQETLPDLLSHYVNDLRVKNMACLLVRGRTRDPEAGRVDLGKYEALARAMDGHMLEGRGYSTFLLSDLVNAKNLYMHDLIYQIADTGLSPVPCHALTLNATLYANGDLVDCEIHETTVGNLRDTGYDFRALWFSGQAECMRNWIRQRGCRCTHECYLNTGILFNAKSYPRLLRYWVRLKRGKSARWFSGGSEK
jgi:MoaA/NifB/PqqE/SkfB family radical SAM enzyme